MNVTVNGKPRVIPVDSTVGDYLRTIDVNPLAVAVELNGRIIKRDDFDATRLADGAKLEVVRMMGGG